LPAATLLGLRRAFEFLCIPPSRKRTRDTDIEVLASLSPQAKRNAVTIFTFEGIEFTVYISISTLRYDDFRLSTFELSKTPPFTIASTQQQQKKKLHNHVS